jgi:hypothetical protein
MRIKVFQPGLILAVFIAVYLVIGLLIVADYGFSSDERIEKRRAGIALTKYGVDLGFFPYDYDDIGHSQFYGTATSMLLLGADTWLSPILNLRAGVVMHYGYFFTFILAIPALYFLIKLFVNPWIALFTTILFATQPLLFGHAFINPKDIPMLAVFLLTVTSGFYIDRHKSWKEGVETKIDLRRLVNQWRMHLLSYSRTALVILVVLVAMLVLIAILKPILIEIFSQIITTAYTDAQSIWGILLRRAATNPESTPLNAYINKGITNLVRLLNASSDLLFLGLLSYSIIIFRKGYKQFPQDLQSRSVLHTFVLHLKNPILITAGLTAGFAISTRIVAIFAGGIAILYLLSTYRMKSLIPVSIYTFFAAFAAYISWPIFWRYGLAAIQKALTLFSDFDPYIGYIHFDGEIYRETEIPRSYLPKLLSLQFTEPLVLLCILGFVIWIGSLLRNRQWSRGQSKLLLVFLWFALPFAYVVITNPIMYNNFRQFIFITPPFFVFAAFAIQFFHDHLQNRVILPLALLMCLVPGILNIISLHPYQYIYYNQFAGGNRETFRDYDQDYQFLAIKEGIEYINEIAPEGANILVWDVEYPQAIYYIRPDININRVAHVSEAQYPDYQYAVIPTIRNVDQRNPEWWEPIHKVSRNGADLVIIYEIDGK